MIHLTVAWVINMVNSMMSSSEKVFLKCFVNNIFLKISENSQKSNYVGVTFSQSCSSVDLKYFLQNLITILIIYYYELTHEKLVLIFTWNT